MMDTRGKKKMKEVEPSRVANRIVLRSRCEEAENERRRARLVENPSPPAPVPFDLDRAFEGVVEYDGSDDNYDDFPDVNDAFFESNHPSAGGSSGPGLEPEAPFVSSSSSQFVHVRRGGTTAWSWRGGGFPSTLDSGFSDLTRWSAREIAEEEGEAAADPRDIESEYSREEGEKLGKLSTDDEEEFVSAA
ncbi:unnamed protein product [Linum trigynum]|uniref:Uncharacterized protein n=1 Tax=Linum trigynum TaxID=586398 RepID=A0AAV2G8Y0_9ROSI